MVNNILKYGDSLPFAPSRTIFGAPIPEYPANFAAPAINPPKQPWGPAEEVEIKAGRTARTKLKLR